MTIALAIAFLALVTALTAVWAASEIAKKIMAKTVSMVKDHATEMYKIAAANDHTIARLKEELVDLKLENQNLKSAIASEAEKRSRDIEQINEHFEDLESGWGQKKPKSAL